MYIQARPSSKTATVCESLSANFILLNIYVD
jgi:hypothetical protein